MIADALSLYLVTNRDGLTENAFLKKIELACQNGVTMVQLREKESSTHDFYKLALKVKSITDEYQIPLIINDRVDICLAVDASGVHIGNQELPIDVTRQLIGQTKWLGVTAKTVERGLEAKKQGANYLGVGAIFPTTTKVQTKETSIADLNSIIEKVGLPVVAIGGIKEENALIFENTKVSGIAIVSEIMQAVDVAKKVQAIKQLVNQIKLKEPQND